MKSQAFVEELNDKSVTLRIDDQLYVMPRQCLPFETQEADVVDIVMFVNERETHRRIEQVRRWLKACGALTALQMKAAIAEELQNESSAD